MPRSLSSHKSRQRRHARRHAAKTATTSSSSSSVQQQQQQQQAQSKKKIQQFLQDMKFHNEWNQYSSSSSSSMAAPGFSHLLGLVSERLEEKQFAWHHHHHSNNNTDNKSALTFRYTVPSRLLFTKLDCTTTLSTFVSIVEDITTWALLLDDQHHFHHSQSFGTESFQAEWGSSAQLGLFPGSVVDVTAQVLSNNNTANPNDDTPNTTGTTATPSVATATMKDPILVQAEIRDAETGSLICTAIHGKYLESSSDKRKRKQRNHQQNHRHHRSRDVLMKFPKLGRWWLNWFGPSSSAEPICPVSLQMSDMLDSLDFVTHTKAFFHLSPKHSSTSSLGTLDSKYVHSGCLAIVLEFMGRQVAQDVLVSPMAYLESIQVHCSTPVLASTRVALEAFVLTKQRRFMTMRVVMTTLDGGIVTEGILSFTDTMQALGKPRSRTLSASNAATGPIRLLTTTTTTSVNAAFSDTNTLPERLATAAIPEFPSAPTVMVMKKSSALSASSSKHYGTSSSSTIPSQRPSHHFQHQHHHHDENENHETNQTNHHHKNNNTHHHHHSANRMATALATAGYGTNHHHAAVAMGILTPSSRSIFCHGRSVGSGGSSTGSRGGISSNYSMPSIRT